MQIPIREGQNYGGNFLTMSSPLECDDWSDGLARRGAMYIVEDWRSSFSTCPFAADALGEKIDPPPTDDISVTARAGFLL